MAGWRRGATTDFFIFIVCIIFFLGFLGLFCWREHGGFLVVFRFCEFQIFSELLLVVSSQLSVYLSRLLWSPFLLNFSKSLNCVLYGCRICLRSTLLLSFFLPLGNMSVV